MGKKSLKHSYTIPCSSTFRDAVSDLALRRNVNVADLARSVALVVPDEHIASFPDPGGPEKDDRETVVLKTGPSKGRPWRRKPRLQVRMAPGLDIAWIRRALALALAVDRGETEVRMDNAATRATDDLLHQQERQIRETREELERLHSIIEVLSFTPLPGGVNNRGDALHILGFSPTSTPSINSLKASFRALATIHHPDGRYGDHKRMSQLNAAMDHLIRGDA